MKISKSILFITIGSVFFSFDLPATAHAKKRSPEAEKALIAARLPNGWKIAQNVENPVVIGDFLERGIRSIGVFITDGSGYEVMVYYDQSPHSRSFIVWKDTDLPSFHGIRLSNEPEYTLQSGYAALCGTPEIKCDANGIPVFHPKRPVLLLDADDISFACQWIGSSRRFRLLTIGD